MNFLFHVPDIQLDICKLLLPAAYHRNGGVTFVILQLNARMWTKVAQVDGRDTE